jgi:trk system potassium uptake protein TrkH
MNNSSRFTIKINQLIAYTLLRFNDLKRTLIHYLNVTSGIACILVTLLLTIAFGFNLHHTTTTLFLSLHIYLLYYFLFDFTLRILFEHKRIRYILLRPTDFLTLYPLSSHISFIASFLGLSQSFFISQITLLLIMFGRLPHINHFLNELKLKPTQMFVFAFLFTIFLGSLLLSLPLSTYGIKITYIDALFTSFSAICVTGLSVVDIGTTFTRFGQIIILILIQIGGLGIMTFSILFGSIMHRKFSHMATSEFQESYNTYNLSETFVAIKFIFKLTFFIEILGAIFLFINWHHRFDHYNDALFYSIFHSISAFCNAGFSLFSTNLVDFQSHLGVISTISTLIILGGLGFPVLYNLVQFSQSRGRGVVLKLHTKLALFMTIVLLVTGTLFIYLFESHQSLSALTQSEKLLISFFHSVSSRTAGFNSIDLSYFSPPTLVFMMILMMIGASPGSTGGGLKTTTVGIMILSFWHNLKQSRHTILYRRTIEWESIQKTFTILILALLILFIFFIGLLRTESIPFVPLLFETVSALGTVGFSMGITAELSSIGKVLIMGLMFIGRLGVLTIAYALSQQKTISSYHYPKERIIIS